MADWYEAVHRLKVEKPTNQADAVGDFLLLLIFTGLRFDEAVSLSWKVVNMKRKSFMVLDPKNGDDVEIPMSDVVQGIFEYRYAVCGDGEWIFPAKSKTGYLNNPYKLIRKVAVESEVQFTPHDLRRTFRTTCDRLGFPDPVSKRLLNHAVNQNDMSQRYFVPDIETLRDYSQKVADALKEDMGF